MHSLSLSNSNLEHTIRSIHQKFQSSDTLKFLSVASVMMLAVSIAPDIMAGDTGAEFKPAWEKMVGMVGGFGGKMIAVVALATALITSALRFNPIMVFGSLGTGITAAFGTTVIDKVVTAVI